ncbi:hypothetical protein [Metabacillus idriensis]|uniref:hypothetical protein n=1 Tax=Metabacillus idriensis TaxID=324768 RepID=UPI00398F9BB5
MHVPYIARYDLIYLICLVAQILISRIGSLSISAKSAPGFCFHRQFYDCGRA